MKKFTVILLVIKSFVLITSSKFNKTEFLLQHDAIETVENSLAFGGDIPFGSDAEIRANSVLMEYKNKEINDAFQNPSTKFPPAFNFVSKETRKSIDKSKVYRIIKIMPKGALLHVHNTASVSADWIYKHVTFRDNLYVCFKSEEMKLKFFKIPDNECEWQLLSEMRKKNEEINERIKKELSFISEYENSSPPDLETSWKKLEKIFDFVAPLIRYKPVFEDYFYQSLQEMYDDNIMYAELRAALSKLYDLEGNKYNSNNVIEMHQDITKRFIKTHPGFIGIKIIYAKFRKSKLSKLRSCVDDTLTFKANYPNILAGFDLTGQEDKGFPLIQVLDTIQPLIDRVPFFFHAGETDWYGLETDENLIDSVLLNTKRIGHGYALLKHPKVMELVKKKHIGIEVCPISNQVLGLVDDLRDHPGTVFFANNFPVVISSDDPALWGVTGLSYDFYEAFMGMMSVNADIRALKKLALNSIQYSSMNDIEKENAKKVWLRKWEEFIDKINDRDF